MMMAMEKCDAVGCSGDFKGGFVYDAVRQLSTNQELKRADPTNLTEAFKSIGKNTELPFTDVGTTAQYASNAPSTPSSGKSR